MYAEQLCCIRVVALREAGQSVNRRSVHVVLETFDIESLRGMLRANACSIFPEIPI